MAARLFAFLLCLAAGGLAGWWLGHDRGAAAGVAAGATAWFIFETQRSARVLRWLRSGDLRAVPRAGGLWGEAAQRARRLLALREAQLAEARARLQDFLSAIQRSPNGVVLLDAGGAIEWFNDTAAAQFGFDPQRDLQQHIVHLVREPDFSAYYHGRNFAQDVVIAAPGSSAARPLKLAVRLHPYGEGRLLLLARDVTAVEQAEVMRRDFVANVSHEIRTPLTVLGGFVETLQHLELSRDEQARYLQLMAQQAQRMQTLVSDLLTLSRLEGSPLPAAAEWTPAPQLLAQCEQEARALAAALDKTLDLRFGPAPPLLVGGIASELLSALSNLVSNAVRYTPGGGSVEVQTRALPDGGVEFAVRDTGPGIAAEHLPRLTERFYRVDRSRSRETGGTGLGLAIVKHVVQRHGGELRIDSRPGAGSTFAIRLPARRVRVQAEAAE
ncbi:phosphate regulon sensor histidine kinase PhoR [Ramlibacter sp.]|uniref:phosphate regulon sensor histidine kinase PhoR n=1 Tax=Ramlibacter sp. TaxID=1917967 RepID=UPI002CFFF5EB|nr:phosphate regulon sensor histidine kinase PhoR [Ramlibacter sp.]HWI80573.1 phosphate regulon sensor histidine kinase PhoR [Ramlibacter sp.]